VAREQRNRDAVGKMKQFASWFTHGVPGGGALRKQIFEAKRGAAVIDAVGAFFEGRARGEAAGVEVESGAELDELVAAGSAYCD
jgi:tRNA-dihydrouridine synthase B